MVELTRETITSRLDDLLQNAKKQETIEALVNIERVRGLIWTVVQRKKFLQHMETKKARERRARAGLCKCCLSILNHSIDILLANLLTEH